MFEMCEFFAPPTETNFAGALLTGSQSACKAACDAFAEAVQSVASNPLDSNRLKIWEKALGLIEFIGYVPAICAADTALKAASVDLIGIEKVTGGIVTVKITGDVDAVQAAVESAENYASRIEA